jgi:hypothetical protein
MVDYVVDKIRTEKEPFEIVIENNYVSRAKRLADETKDELSKVLKRVENVNDCLFLFFWGEKFLKHQIL